MAVNHAERLRARGIQVTAQRLAVLRAVSADPHCTADAVAGAVRSEIGAISLQSVYDALALMAAEGLVRRIQPAGSPARFEDRVGDNHHHLICRVCGRLVDVDCAAGGAPCLTPPDSFGYEVDEAEVAFWGRCPDCLARSKRPDVPPDSSATAATHADATTRARQPLRRTARAGPTPRADATDDIPPA